jgi:hypothetical protein
MFGGRVLCRGLHRLRAVSSRLLLRERLQHRLMHTGRLLRRRIHRLRAVSSRLLLLYGL